jgi:hypothetical protein
MHILTRYNTGIVILILISIAFFIFYNPEYPPAIVETFEINSPELEHRILIASQSSHYKNTVVLSVVRHFKQRPVYIKVIDVTALPGINENDWDAIVVIHTWENWQPPPVVKTWLELANNLNKVVILTTSGNGLYKMQGINAITSASIMTNIPADVAEVVSRVDLILRNNTTSTKGQLIN